MRCLIMTKVSTHSRLKATGSNRDLLGVTGIVSTHSRLKATGIPNQYLHYQEWVSTHSRLKATGCICRLSVKQFAMFQHTAA